MSPILDPAHVSLECRLGYSEACAGVVDPNVPERRRQPCRGDIHWTVPF